MHAFLIQKSLRDVSDLSIWQAVITFSPPSPCSVSEAEYEKAIEEEIKSVVKLQVELDIDVLVHGEPEVTRTADMHPCSDMMYLI